jgi:quercetin dioxygenase-like cupin family protein
MSQTALQNEPALSANEETFDIFGVLLQFLVTPEQTGNEISLYRGTMPPGIVIPLHSHDEPEVFYVLEGEVEIYQESEPRQGWSKIGPGETIAIPGHRKHALRNTSSQPVTKILVTQNELYVFFRELAKPFKNQPPAPPAPEEMQKLFETAAKHHYWMGSPEENAAIGISLR